MDQENFKRFTPRMDPGTFFTIKEVAEMLGVSQRTVYRLMERKELVGYMIGGQWRISDLQVNAYLDKVRGGKK